MCGLAEAAAAVSKPRRVRGRAPGRMCQCRESSVGGILVGCEGITQKQITSLKRKINRLGEAEPTFTTSKLAWCLGLLCFSAGLELRGGFCFRSSLEPVGLLNWCQEAQNRECRVYPGSGRAGKLPVKLCPLCIVSLCLGGHGACLDPSGSGRTTWNRKRSQSVRVQR